MDFKNKNWDLYFVKMEDLTTKEHIKKIYDIIEKNGENIEKLTRALTGESEFGSIGFRQRMEKTEETLYEHKVRMDEIDKRFNKIYQRVVGICIGITIAASAVGWVIQNSISKAKASTISSVNEIESRGVGSDIQYPIINKNKIKSSDD